MIKNKNDIHHTILYLGALRFAAFSGFLWIFLVLSKFVYIFSFLFSSSVFDYSRKKSRESQRVWNPEDSRAFNRRAPYIPRPDHKNGPRVYIGEIKISIRSIGCMIDRSIRSRLGIESKSMISSYSYLK